MDIRLYDNYEEDGQLSLFGFDDADYEMEVQPLPDMAEETAKKKTAVQRDAAVNTGLHLAPGGSGIRIRKCATCGKHLFVSEVSGGYASSCNNCGIEYFQKV